VGTHDGPRPNAGWDPATYADSVLRHRERLVSIAWSVVGNRDDALDAVQDAIVRGMSAVGGLRDPAAFGSWMDTLVRRSALAIRAARVRRREVGAPLAEPVADPPPLEQRAWLRDLLGGLPHRHREAMYRFYVAGWSIAELASALAKPPGTVKRWLFEARRMALRRAIEMEGRVVVLGPDLSEAEYKDMEAAAAAHGLHCDRIDDVWAARRSIVDLPPVLVIVAKRPAGSCDAFVLAALLKGDVQHALDRIPLVMVGPGDTDYAHAAWCAGADCYLARPCAGDDLTSFIGRLVAGCA